MVARGPKCLDQDVGQWSWEFASLRPVDEEHDHEGTAGRAHHPTSTRKKRHQADLRSWCLEAIRGAIECRGHPSPTTQP